MTIEENELEIIEEFSMFDDWMDKYEFIIEIGKELSVFEDKFKVEDNLSFTIRIFFNLHFRFIVVRDVILHSTFVSA